MTSEFSKASLITLLSFSNDMSIAMKNPKSNTYTMEAKGTKKLIHQLPWMKDGKCVGMVELSIVLPADMPHHER